MKVMCRKEAGDSMCKMLARGHSEESEKDKSLIRESTKP